MHRLAASVALCALAWLLVPQTARAGDEWVNFNLENSRVVAANSLVVGDTKEKDYAHADLDNDGDIDLIIVRKQIATNSIGFRNVLLMNENGILVDRTEDFALLSSDSSNGFLDPTNDRDVEIGDVDNDGWLDFVTFPACNGCSGSKSFTHARVYMNLGEDINGVWQGFRYEEPRTPQLAISPNYCGGGLGDINDDGYIDIYGTDYNSNLEDTLLMNLGEANPGFFVNETDLRTTSAMHESSFGTEAAMADMNQDGNVDIVKSENGPVEVLYNDGGGFFTQMQSLPSIAAYHFNLGDLNNDGLIDIVVGDDGTDRYFLNEGPSVPGGVTTFSSFGFQFGPGESDEGFSNDGYIVDFDKDGWNDVIMTDIDVDTTGCTRHTNFYHNLGGDVGGFVTLMSDRPGGMTEFILEGTHDAAVFDINGDSFLDVVLGRCLGTEVWMNEPPFGVTFDFPEGLPELIDPDNPATLRVQLGSIGGATIEPAETKLATSINGAPFEFVAMTDIGGGMFETETPDVECLDSLDYYFIGKVQETETEFTSPPFAPGQTHNAIGAVGQAETFQDGLEAEFNWTVVDDAGLIFGSWEQAANNGTLFNGIEAAPYEDAEPGPDTTMSVVTTNCPSVNCTPPNFYDVDGGPTHLISPPFNLLGTDAEFVYALWFFVTGHEDSLTVSVSNDDGENWVTVEVIENSLRVNEQPAWVEHGFKVSDFVEPTAEVRVRFSVIDNLPDTMTEAGLDNFRVNEILCGATCLTTHCSDTNRDGIRDDNCVWSECDGTPCNGLIQQIPIVFADMGGPNGACEPDGTADNNDRFAALNCFSNQDTLGNPNAFACEANPPAAFNTDAGGAGGACEPDGVCDGNDAFHALNAFEGDNPCSCPGNGPTPTQPGRRMTRPTQAGIVAQAKTRATYANELIAVDFVFDRPVDNLRGYQLDVDVSGGRRGTLQLVDIVIDEAKSPVMMKTAPWSAFNVDSGQLVVGTSGDPIAAPEGGYLATFVYRATDHALGKFTIEANHVLEAGGRSFLFTTPQNGEIQITESTPTHVLVRQATGRVTKAD